MAAARKGRRDRIEGQPTITVRTRASKPDRHHAGLASRILVSPHLSTNHAPDTGIPILSCTIYTQGTPRRRNPLRVTDDTRGLTTKDGRPYESAGAKPGLPTTDEHASGRTGARMFPRNVRHESMSPEETCITPTVWFLCRRSVPEWSLSAARCRRRIEARTRAPVEPPSRTSRFATGSVGGFGILPGVLLVYMTDSTLSASKGAKTLPSQPYTAKVVR